MADIIPPRRGEELTPTGRATIRFAEYLDRVADGVNDNTNALTQPQTQTVLSLLSALEARLGSGDALTSDEAGFTVDTDKLTVDMTEA